MQHLIRAHLDHSFALYHELVGALTSDQLKKRLPVPSNPVGAQLWCVVGGRESWARAIESGAWAGFSCSLSAAGAVDPAAVAGALTSSAAAVRAAIEAATGDDDRTALILDLLVHESQHQGQLLRYLLGLKIDVPPAWKRRFAL